MTVVDVHHWLVACGTLEEKLKGFLERKSLAARCLASVKFVAFLVLKPGFKFFKNTALLVKDEAFQLVGLESPVKNKPACFLVTKPLETHEGVVVKSVERLANSVKTYFCLIHNLDVRDLVNLFKNLNYSDSFFAKQCSDILQRLVIHKEQF